MPQNVVTDADLLNALGASAPAKGGPAGVTAATPGLSDNDLLGALSYGKQTAIPQATVSAYKAAYRPDWLDDALHHATGGLIDKADALGTTLVGSGISPTSGLSFWDRYRGNLQSIRNAYGDYAIDNPNSDMGARAAGVVAPMMIAGPEREAASLGQAMFRGARSGATYGAMYGLGSTNDQSLAQDAVATGAGALTGGATGGALPAATSVLLKAPMRAATNVSRPFVQSGVEGIAGRILNDAADTGPAALQPAPLPGMKPTLGQSTNNAGLQWLERSIAQGSPRGAELAEASRTANNQAVQGAIRQIGNPTSDYNQTISDALDTLYARDKATASNAFKAADLGSKDGLSSFQLNNRVQNYVNGLTTANRKIIDPDLLSTLQEMADNKTRGLDEIQDWRSNLSDAIRSSYRNGQNNKARVLGGIDDVVDGFLQDATPRMGQDIQQWNAARQAWAQFKQKWQTPAPLRNVLGVDRYGADKVPLSATAGQFIRTGTGAPEAFNAYLSAISDAKGNLDPAASQAARDAFVQRFLDSTQTTALDQTGAPLISRAKTTNFLNDYGHVVNSRLFTPQQRALLGNIQDAVDMSARTMQSKPPGGSDTFPKLAGQKFMDVLIGPGAVKLVKGTGAVVGAGLGNVVEGGGHLGGMATLYGMYKGAQADELLNKLYSAPRDKVVNLVTQAMHDPQLAKVLMMKASPANSKIIAPTTRNKILGILGAQAAPAGVAAAQSASGSQ